MSEFFTIICTADVARQELLDTVEWVIGRGDGDLLVLSDNAAFLTQRYFPLQNQERRLKNLRYLTKEVLPIILVEEDDDLEKLVKKDSTIILLRYENKKFREAIRKMFHGRKIKILPKE